MNKERGCSAAPFLRIIVTVQAAMSFGLVLIARPLTVQVHCKAAR